MIKTLPLTLTRKLQFLMALGAIGLAVSLYLAYGVIDRQIFAAHASHARAVIDVAMGVAEAYNRDHRDLDSAQAQARTALNAMRFGDHGGDYVYVLQLDGTMLVHPRAEWIGRNISEDVDANGVPLLKLIRDHALAGDVAFTYQIHPAMGGTPRGRIAFARVFKPWGWIIVTSSFDDGLHSARWQVTHSFELALVPVLLTIALGTAWVSRRVARPIRVLAKLTDGIRDKDYTREIPGQRRSDEIGLLARALAELQAGAQEADDLRRQRDLAAKVFDTSREGLVITDAAGVALTVNPAFEYLSGLAAARVVGQGPGAWQSRQHDQAFYDRMWETVESEGRWEGEVRNRRSDGAATLVHQIIYRVCDSAGAPVNHVIVQSDITETRLQQDRIWYLAYHDPLTQLPNRSLLMDRLNHAIAAAERGNTRMAVLFIDLDRFKTVNDTLGHDIGDQVLQHMSRQLRTVIRRSDTVARMGGDEFVVLMEGLTSGEQISTTLTRILAVLAAPVELSGSRVHCPPSIGVATYPEDGTNPVMLLKHADAAMYAAKASGGNTFCFFSAELTEKAASRLSLESGLRQALAENQFQLYFQPKVCFRTGAPRGAEALIRWIHPQQGVISPAQFIPLAEETGLIGDIGQWVVAEACRTIASWPPALARNLKIAVNVSAHQLTSAGFIDTVMALLDHHGVSVRQIELELTESAVMHNPASTIAILSELRQRGLSIAVDDFGTGYSCLSYLKTLPIDVLKIDRAFVMNAAHDTADAEIVRTIIALARALRLHTVAEGVETEEQWTMLRRAGCDLAQGFLHGRPMPAADFLAWLEGRMPREPREVAALLG